MKITEELTNETSSVADECRSLEESILHSIEHPIITWTDSVFSDAANMAFYTKLAELQLRIKALEAQISQKNP